LHSKRQIIIGRRDPTKQESAAELSVQIRNAHAVKLADTKEKLSRVPWIQRIFGKKEVNDDRR
jgi:hypothetical protein